MATRCGAWVTPRVTPPHICLAASPWHAHCSSTLLQLFSLQEINLLSPPPHLMAGSPGAPQKLPLHHAAKGGREFELACLLAEGSDVNAIDGWGLTPLHSAATSGQAACIARLVAAGADLEARASVGTPLHAAAENGQVRSYLLACFAWGFMQRRGACRVYPLYRIQPLFLARRFHLQR